MLGPFSTETTLGDLANNTRDDSTKYITNTRGYEDEHEARNGRHQDEIYKNEKRKL